METVQDIEAWLDAQIAANPPFRYNNWSATEKAEFHAIIEARDAAVRAMFAKYMLVVPNKATLNIVNGAMPHWLKMHALEATDGTLLAPSKILIDINTKWKGAGNAVKGWAIVKKSNYTFPEPPEI